MIRFQRALHLTISTLALVAVVSLTGCGEGRSSTTSPSGTSGGKKQIHIGIVAKSVSNPVFQAAHAGALDAGKELGAKYNADIIVEIQTPATEDAQKQAEAVDNFSRSGFDGIAVACSDAGTLKPAIDRAVDNKVIVVTFDADSPKSKRMSYYGTDDVTCGHRVLDELAAVMGDKGVIAILAGNQSAPNLQTRVKSVREELAKFQNMKEVNDGNGVFFHVETPEEAVKAVDLAQRSNPTIGGWAMVGGWPLFTRDALKWPPGEVKVVAVDALPAQIEYLKSGHVQVLLAQDCYGWGHKSVEVLLEKIVNNVTPKETRMIDPLARVTKENAEEWSKNWDKWLSKK